MVYLKFPDIAIWIIKSLGPLLQLIILALLFISVIIHAAQDQIDHDQKAVQQIPLQKSNQTTWSVPHDFLKKEMEDWESPDSKGRGWGDFNNKFKPWLYLDMESQFTFKTPDLKEKQPELNALHKLRSYLQKKQNLAMLNAAPSSVLGKNNTEDPEAIITPAVKQPNIPGIHKAPSVATQTESQPPSGRDTDSDQSGEKTHQSNNKAFKKIPGGNGGGGGDKDDHFSRQEPPGELVQYTYKVTRTLNIDGKEHEVHGKLNQYNEHLYCAICHDLVSNKVMHTSCCAHNFCRMDFKRLKSKTCPFCGSEKVNFTELNLKSQINLIKWSCSYKSCRYRGNIGEMTDHLLYTCTYRERDPEAVMLAKPVGNTTKIETEINNVLVARFTVDSYYQRDEVNKKSTAAKYGSSRHSNNAVHPISEACNSSSFDGSQTPQPDPLISNYSECAVTPKPSSLQLAR